MSILEIKDLEYYFRDGDSKRYILKGVDYNFEKGKCYAIIGESGSGKTTLLSLIAALDSPKSGEIVFDGENIEEIGFEKYRRNKIGIVFQSYNLIPYMTAVENVEVAMEVTDNELPADLKATAFNLLDYIGIDKEKARRKVNSLSGGEQQRVAIARAISTNVDLIVADEPTGNLDSDMEKEIVEIFKMLAAEHDKCVIIITHSPTVAQGADEIIRLENGVLTKYE